MVRINTNVSCAVGTMHIVLDDGNVSDSDVFYCINYAREENDWLGLLIGEILLYFTEEERQKMYEKHWNNPNHWSNRIKLSDIKEIKTDENHN